ncbi:GDSL-like Lipase/Acylhydrolase family protein [Methylobacterium phyllostachyos]|uniref:GDSL-like Lipase/Acylhydrolase family protein n=1 Tax=Methylobacterium phyllostachyos TaxID=582672 RepID=A0A1G9TY71_9HYPH|nr:SGNH/GDSL hydrolase family protein [Methylobacterium phyllostachyos]SDM52354.1 GDSL-like Lipase/Acylhydrolase family protein [Methylobacterium phyllostachyos]
MRRLALPIGGGLILLAIGGLAGWRLHRPAADARAYAVMRLIAIQVSLDEAPPDYAFWGGDSQVELQPGGQPVCGLPLVNGGVSGSTAAAYADHLAHLTFPVHPHRAALTIGTNDILLKNKPRSAEPAARFEAAAETIVRRLQSLAPRVVVTALPPVGRELAALVDAAAVADYSQRLRGLCGRLGCTFTDPFAALRDGDTGYAKPGAMRDGLHLAAYRPALAALQPALCGP